MNFNIYKCIVKQYQYTEALYILLILWPIIMVHLIAIIHNNDLHLEVALDYKHVALVVYLMCTLFPLLLNTIYTVSVCVIYYLLETIKNN